jgi:putative transposase
VKGRKRFVMTDSLGLIWALMVVPADVQDRDGGRWLLAAVRGLLPRLREVIADSGFSRKFVLWVRRCCGWAVTITQKAAEGFVVQPRRWVVERTFAWLARYRRLLLDHERLPEVSEAMVLGAMTHLMLRRLQPTKKPKKPAITKT